MRQFFEFDNNCFKRRILLISYFIFIKKKKIHFYVSYHILIMNTKFKNFSRAAWCALKLCKEKINLCQTLNSVSF